jgi:hypothetical protein
MASQRIMTSQIGSPTLEKNSVAIATISALLVGVASILVYAGQFAQDHYFSVAATGIVLAGASFACGGLLGFLFGIPRTLQGDRDTTSPSAIGHVAQEGANQGGAGRTNTDSTYRANTNLEQISDWLTKILVGVGLTQIGRIPGALQALGTYVAPALGGDKSGPSFAIVIFLYFVIAGFFPGYLFARLLLPGAFRQADLAAIGDLAARAVENSERAIDVSKQVQQRVDDQAQCDALALSLVSRLLDPDPNSRPVGQDELNKVVSEASPAVKVTIFNIARSMRKANWRTDKAKVERTIPVFRSLIASDVKREFHSNHGQLGYALKDKEPPDWETAEAELTTAIEMRGPERGLPLYDFNRALCRINRDRAYSLQQQSNPSIRQDILGDLHVAAQSGLGRLIREDPTIAKWMQQNGLTVDGL